MVHQTGHWARRRSRKAAMQAVYQWQMTGSDVVPLEQEYRAAGALKKADESFFSALVRGVLLRTEELDALLAPVLDRPVEQLDRVEAALLRLGAFELKHRIDVPYRVVIDEYVELAKTYGAEESYKYINGVLDRLAAELRQAERGT
ncbi:MAG TPA: transcription antitermination factor NusB [Pseudomonadales bacterium]